MQILKYILLAIICAALISCSPRIERVWPFLPDPNVQLNEYLQKIISVDYQDMDIAEVVEDLRVKSNINIVVAMHVSISGPIPITLKLTNVRVGTVLLFIQNLSQLPLSVKDDVFVFGM